MYISNTFPCNTSSDGPGTPLSEPLVWRIEHHFRSWEAHLLVLVLLPISYVKMDKWSFLVWHEYFIHICLSSHYANFKISNSLQFMRIVFLPLSSSLSPISPGSNLICLLGGPWAHCALPYVLAFVCAVSWNLHFPWINLLIPVYPSHTSLTVATVNLT